MCLSVDIKNRQKKQQQREEKKAFLDEGLSKMRQCGTNCVRLSCLDER